MSVLARKTGRAGTGTGDAAAHGGVEALHAHRIGEVILHRALDAGQGVVEAGQPAIVLGHELVEERGALIGRGAGQLPPCGGGALAARNHGLAVADFEHAAEEIEHVRVGLQARHAGDLANGLSGVRVQLGKAQIEAAGGGVGDEVLDEIGGILVLVLGTAPILGTEHHGDRGGVEIVGERAIGAQRLFQIVERKPGVRGEEGARRIDGFEHHFTAAAAAHAEAEDAQQFAGSGRFAGIDFDGASLAGQLFQFARLREVAVDQLEVLGLFERFVIVGRLVAVGYDVARQCGKNVGRVGIGSQGGHAGERAQRTGDVGGACAGRRNGRGRRAEGDGLATGRAVGIEVGVSGDAVASQKI